MLGFLLGTLIFSNILQMSNYKALNAVELKLEFTQSIVTRGVVSDWSSKFREVVIEMPGSNTII
jgi:hypothetical protein